MMLQSVWAGWRAGERRGARGRERGLGHPARIARRSTENPQPHPPTHPSFSFPHTVRMLREELQLLQEPGSYVGEVIKVRWRRREGGNTHE